MEFLRRLSPTLRWTLIVLAGLLVLLAGLWLSRARLAAEFARAYFRQHGITSQVEIGGLGLSGVSGRFALGPADTPDISAERIELHFDPLRFIPRVVEVRLVRPVLRAKVEDSGRVTLGSLQAWIDSLAQEKGRSRFVSDDLAVSLEGLRALLMTPGGALEIGGDIKLVRNLPVTASLKMLPARIALRGWQADVKGASLRYDSASGALDVRVAGSGRQGAHAVTNLAAQASATKLHWEDRGGRLHVTAPALRLQLAADGAATQTAMLDAPQLDVTARKLALVGGTDGSADIEMTASGGVAGALVKTMTAADPVLGRALAANLSNLNVALKAHVEKQGARFAVYVAPSQLRGARGAVLNIAAASLYGPPESRRGRLVASLVGGGMPVVRVSSSNLAMANGVFTADAEISARFGYAMLRGAEIVANTAITARDGVVTVQPNACARFALQALHPGASDLAREVRTTLCPQRGTSFLTLKGKAWSLRGMARNASAVLPLANAVAENADASLAFDGQGSDFHGTATVTAASLRDRTAPVRFNPLQGSGSVMLEKGVWRGRFAVTKDKHALADVTFTHTLGSSSGTAHIAAASLAFTPDSLQPADISPLLAAFRRAEGKVNFQGDIDWTPAAITSRGTLDINSLDFLSPMGRARAVKTQLVFTSLLPPMTADNQRLTISRVDWTLPFSSVDLHFGFSPTAVKVDSVQTGWAEGKVSLGGFTVNLANPKAIGGTATLNGISLAALVAASNLGGRMKMEGKVSGSLPFTSTNDGLRIVNGRISADGPGRLSIDRTLWTKGEPAANAVQDFAYQALENLAFESMTAELNSIAGGRMQILFHIKGKSDPAKPQTADIAISDVVNGTALQKSVPLPSGTPIDLTLDTSLNFDELLKSYAEAWSKSLSPEGRPDAKRGATP